MQVQALAESSPSTVFEPVRQYQDEVAAQKSSGAPSSPQQVVSWDDQSLEPQVWQP
jgi:hypothetical protein